jgi:hypothetical protein
MPWMRLPRTFKEQAPNGTKNELNTGDPVLLVRNHPVTARGYNYSRSPMARDSGISIASRNRDNGKKAPKIGGAESTKLAELKNGEGSRRTVSPQKVDTIKTHYSGRFLIRRQHNASRQRFSIWMH